MNMKKLFLLNFPYLLFVYPLHRHSSSVGSIEIHL